MEFEQIIMQLITNSGTARSNCLKAVKQARVGKFNEADKLLVQANESLLKAHQIQTGLIQQEVKGQGGEPTLLLIHAQDHLMNAMTVRELVIEMVEDYRHR